MRSSLRRIPRAVAGVAVLAAGLSATAAPAFAASAPALATSAAVHSQATTSPTPSPAPVSGPITHPDADSMGSTIRANEAAAPPGASGVSPNAVANQPQGLDVSGYQPSIDWNATAANGARFAYVKATEGTGYISPQYANQYTGSYNAGLIRGAYHFGLPDRATGTDQANYFVNNGGAWSGDGFTLPPMLDIEYNPYGPTCYGLTGTQMASWIRDFSNTVNARTGRYPTIYSTLGWWNQCTASDTTFGATNPLFLANYASTPGTMPAGWGYQSIWQYSDAGTFPGDQDVFNGDMTALRTFAGNTQTPIDQRYSALGGVNSFLGAPTDSEHAVGSGTVRDYQGGSLYNSAATGVHEVHGAIRDHFNALGGPGGFLGYPTTDESATPDGVGRYNHFANAGSIYYTPKTGARSVHGAIRDHWAGMGWETGPIGYPTTDESTTPDGVGHYNHFTGGDGASIYYTPSTGAQSVHGAVRDHWAALGYETGPMGYPTTDESPSADGVGRYNGFTGGDGAAIYWSPATGAQSVHGAIRARWASLGYETGSLGYPTSDEFAVPGGRRNTFQHGSITFSNGTTQVG